MNVHSYQYHTIAETFELICKDENPWIAIGNFLNDWWYYASVYRVDLIETPLPVCDSKKAQQWAAFCAAMIETLCIHSNVPCPIWIFEERFVLPQPWFYYPDSGSRARLLASSPLSFKKRNVYVSNRVLAGKWDLSAHDTHDSRDFMKTEQNVRV